LSRHRAREIVHPSGFLPLQLDGKTYAGTQNTFADKNYELDGFNQDTFLYHAEVKDALQRDYAPQSHHKVHFDPTDPSRSFIDTDINCANLCGGAGLAGVLFLAMGLFSLARSAYKKNWPF